MSKKIQDSIMGRQGSAEARPTSGRDVGRGAYESRRDFLIVLGGAAVGIAGYFLVRSTPAPQLTAQQPQAGDPRCPVLRPDVCLTRDGAYYTMQTAVGETLGAVNAMGYEVVRRLDGRHRIPELAAALQTHAGLTTTETPEQLAGKIACFVAQLGEMGLLRQQYYVTIFESMA